MNIADVGCGAYSFCMKKLNKTDAAKHLKVSRQTIYDLIKQGVLIPDENGLMTFDDDNESASKCQDRSMECQDTSSGCQNSFTESGTTHSATAVVVGSRRLKNQFILDLKGEIEKRNQLIDRQSKTLDKQDRYVRLLQAYIVLLEDIVRNNKIDLHPYMRKFFTEYLSPEHVQYADDLLKHLRDDAIHIDREFDLAQR